MNAREFDRHVQRLLDRRLDPLDDAAACAFLAAHPEQLPGFAAMCTTLRQLRALAPPAPRPPRSRRSVAVAALLAAVVAVAWPRPAAPAAATRSMILAAELREIRPRAYAAVQYSVRQPLLVDATTTFEIYECRSQRR